MLYIFSSFCEVSDCIHIKSCGFKCLIKPVLALLNASIHSIDIQFPFSISKVLCTSVSFYPNIFVCTF